MKDDWELIKESRDRLRMMSEHTRGHYERYFLQQKLRSEQIKLNRIIGQYKRKLKKQYYYDEFLVSVIDSIY